MSLEDASPELAANFCVPSNSTVNFVEPELEKELKKKKAEAIIDVMKEEDDNIPQSAQAQAD